MTSETEVDTVRDALMQVTGAPFETAKAGRARMFVREESEWEVACLDLAHANHTAHLDKAWKDKSGIIWFETSDLADMISLVEQEYGSDSAANMKEPEVGKAPPQAIPEEVAEFPLVVELLNEYDRVVKEVAKRRGLNLTLLYDGGAGLTSVRIATRTSFRSDDPSETHEVVQSVSKTLKEAYDSIEELRSRTR